MTFELRLGGGEGASSEESRKESVPGRGNSKCHGPEAGSKQFGGCRHSSEVRSSRVEGRSKWRGSGQRVGASSCRASGAMVRTFATTPSEMGATEGMDMRELGQGGGGGMRGGGIQEMQ